MTRTVNSDCTLKCSTLMWKLVSFTSAKPKQRHFAHFRS